MNVLELEDWGSPPMSTSNMQVLCPQNTILPQGSDFSHLQFDQSYRTTLSRDVLLCTTAVKSATEAVL